MSNEEVKVQAALGTLEEQEFFKYLLKQIIQYKLKFREVAPDIWEGELSREGGKVRTTTLLYSDFSERQLRDLIKRFKEIVGVVEREVYSRYGKDEDTEKRVNDELKRKEEIEKIKSTLIIG